MNARQVCLCVLAMMPVLSACPIGPAREAIGVSCAPDGADCSLDHVCTALEAGANDAVCAPLLDLGSCPAPNWPQRVGNTRDEALLVDDPAELARLDNLRLVEGDVSIRKSNEAPPGSVLDIADVCAASALQRVQGRLTVYATNLTTLDGLQSLSSTGAGVVVVGNRELTDVTPLAHLLVSGDVEAGPGTDLHQIVIANNEALPAASITELVESLPDNIEVTHCGNRGELPCEPGLLVRLGLAL